MPCKPAKQLYRGKYIDQIADTPIGLIKLQELGSHRIVRAASTPWRGGRKIAWCFHAEWNTNNRREE